MTQKQWQGMLDAANYRAERAAADKQRLSERLRAVKEANEALAKDNERLRERLEACEAVRREAGPAFKVGDRVHVPQLPGTGTIDEIHWTRGRVTYRVRYFIAGTLKSFDLYDVEVKAMPVMS